MSRIGNKPVQIPAGVDVAVNGTHVTVKGPKGTLENDFYSKLTISVEDNVLTVSRPDDERETRAMHGLTRALIHNMVVGDAPEGITFEVPDNTHINVKGISKQQVGQVAAEIRSKRPPEPYKGKGIHYVGEHIRRKLGKAAK